MNSIEKLKKRITETISRSSVPEDMIHSANTVAWLFRIHSEPDIVLHISALGHDIERAIECRKVRREDFDNYDAFKSAHALNSAVILRELMLSYGIEKNLISDVYTTVLSHEKGGCHRSDILKTADTLSFFEVNLPLFYKREGKEKTLDRCIWGYQRLPEERRELITAFRYDDEAVSQLLRDTINLSKKCQ